MRQIAVLGASGHGKVVADLAELLGYKVVFFDRSWPEQTSIAHWPVQGDQQQLIEKLQYFEAVLVAVGNNRTREERQTELQAAGAATIVTLVHPTACVSRYATIAKGAVVFANAVVNADAEIGKGGIINTGATVDHDCRLGDFVHISPGAHLAGNVSVGDRSWVGIGASVRQGVNIGSDAMIGAGAVVVADVPSGSCVVGIPARPIAR